MWKFSELFSESVLFTEWSFNLSFGLEGVGRDWEWCPESHSWWETSMSLCSHLPAPGAKLCPHWPLPGAPQTRLPMDISRRAVMGSYSPKVLGGKWDPDPAHTVGNGPGWRRFQKVHTEPHPIKDDVLLTYYGALLSRKKRWNTAICSNVAGPWEYLAEQNRSVRKS